MLGWLSLAFAASTTPIGGGEWVVDHWNQDDGLPLRAVKYTALDRAGFLWIATLEGLYRFDGDTFTLLHRAAFPGLRVNRIIGLTLDPRGALWFVDETGVVCRTDPVASDPAAAARCWEADEGGLRVDAHGEVYAASGAQKLGPDGPTRWPGLPVDAYAVQLDREGLPFFGVRPRGFGRLDADGQAHVDPGPQAAPATPREDGDGHLWVATGGELWHMAPGPPRRVTRGLTGWLGDIDGWIWFRSAEGEGRARGDVVEHTPPPWDVPLNETYHAFRASDGAVWESVDSWVGRDHVRLPVDNCRLASDGGDGAWLACSDGLRHVRRALARSLPPSDPTYVESRGVAIDAEGGIYEDSRMGVYYRAPGATDATPIRTPDGRRIRSAFARDGAPWGEVDRTICRLVRGVCTPPLLDREDTTAAWEARVGQLTADPFPLPDGRLLLSRFGHGLAVADHDRIADRTAPSPGLDMRGFLVRGATLWIGTEDRGLCRIDDVADVLGAPIRCLPPEAGVIGTQVTDIREDAHERLWLATNRGVLVVALRAVEEWFAGRADWVPGLRLDSRDGLTSRDTNATYGATAVDPRGWFWYPTMRGVSGIDVDAVRLAPPATPRIVSVRSGSDVLDAADVRLSQQPAPLQITWTVPEMVRADQLWFRTRLGGEWRPPTRERTAVETRLPPGASRFEVQAVLGGEWSPVASVAIYRAPTFPESDLFPAVLVLGGVAGAGAVAWVWGAARRARQRELEAEVRRRTEELVAAGRVVADQRDRLGRQAAELQELAHLKSRLVANLSHELRTPLMLVLAPLERLERELSGAPADAVRLARRNAERLSQLVSQLFDAASLESGRLPLRLRRIDLAAFTRDVAERFRPAMELRGLALTVDAPPALPTWADPDLLDKVVTNLLANAMKFTWSGGVHVRLEVRGEMASLTVRDTGRGIAPEHLERVFERFYQVESGDDRGAEGAGIGLALAKDLVELHGGTITARSEPGAGSTFEVQLPLGMAHVGLGDLDPDARGSDATTPASPRGAPVALVVEDHAELRSWLRDALAEHYDVVTAEDGVVALARLAEHPVALVVADVMMPRLDGISLCRAIRARPDGGDLPIVLVSARGEGARAEAMAAGASAYLQKPVTLAHLLDVALDLVPATTRAREAEESADDAANEEANRASAEDPAPRSEVERELLTRLEHLARAGFADPAFSVEVLGKRAGMSRRTLQRALVRLTGHPPNTWLQEMRLLEAQRRLQRGESVAEAAGAIGWTPSYLARAYVAWFGRRPSEERG